MGESTNQPNDATPADRQAVNQVLQTVAQDLRSLQQNVVSHLSQDVERLQSERSRLLNDIERLQAQHEMLQSEHEILLSQRQLAQQKTWAKQLAQALAEQLYRLLADRLNSSDVASNALPAAQAKGVDPATQQVLMLDETLNHALNALQQDLGTYHSSLTQQLNRMQSLEKQGEVLLEALVSRLSDRLQAELAAAPPPTFPTTYPAPSPPSNGGAGTPVLPSTSVTAPQTRRSRGTATAPHTPTASNGTHGRSQTPPTGNARVQSPPLPPPPPSSPPPSPPSAPRATVSPPSRKNKLAQQGLLFILFSTLALSLHNVVVRIIGGQTSIFGIFSLPGSITLDSLNDSLLILWLRMLVVVPIMMIIAGILYPNAWQDVKRFSLARDSRQMRNVIGSGTFLFLSQVLIYIAIATIGPGVAVTILFMYPLITVPLAWFLFGDRPTNVRWGVMAAILFGVILTALPRLTAENLSGLGILTAGLSGVFFALYLISMQISFRKMHPVPVSLVQFITIFVLTSVMLVFFFPVQEAPTNLPGLLIGGVVLGSLTLVGYLLNNLGVQRMGAARASIIAASGPVLTALLAFLITGDALAVVQWGGIVLVTLGILGLSLERMFMQKKAAKAQ
ncbi:MAG: EamA family transporter [Cyanobacteria bacterium J06638_22]